jgi:uncharacterized protein with PIN domain
VVNATLTHIASRLRVSGYPWRISPDGYEVELRDGSGRFLVTSEGKVSFFPDMDNLASFVVSSEFRNVLEAIHRMLNDPNRHSFRVMEPW